MPGSASSPEEASTAPSAPAAYQVRRAAAGDHEGVTRELAAYLAFLGEDMDADGLDHDVANWPAEYDGVAGVMLVVVDPAGHVVGTAAVRRLAPEVAELKRMWLRPDCRGHGLARLLMDRCLEEARGLGARTMRLDSEHRLEAAVRLYRGYGFRDIPDYNRNPRANVWMELPLT